ncbi:hypothetical protein IFR04_013459 [Cadophora malorum]|uniref:histidine kinase n=1 Tax=Cadophora malorum TaxID=108018 RepID=A0A8H7T2I3_9HELO|nr:hypothetical protein IFR04_013459 [Cadophora malorum]
MEHSSNQSPPSRVTESQRALELRKFFAPLEEEQEHFDEPNNGILIGDAALSAYAETVTWRLRGIHAMVSLVDRAGQYFIAGAISDNDGVVTNDSSWFGSTFIPNLGGPYLFQQAANVMEHLETRRQAAERRRVILMSQGIATFLEKASLVMSPGPEAASTSLDKKSQASAMDERRPNPAGTWVSGGHSVSETEEPSEPLNATVVDKISMTLDQAAVILRKSLELNSGGVVFLDTTIGFTATSCTDAYLDDTTIVGTQFQQNKDQQPQQQQETGNSSLKQPVYEVGKKLSQQSIKASTSKHRMSKVQAISAAEIATSDLDSSILDGKTLQSLLNSYPKGNNCSGTLLDTIDHILDYSKINSFERSDTKDTISNELYRVTNLALLCEDLVNGMIVAREFRGAQSTYLSSIAPPNDLEASHNPPSPAVNIILDIEHQDWNFKVQAGALRRIIMNIFGNAQKYTTSGYILIQVRLRKMAQDGSTETAGTSDSELLIRVRDTGKGMSSEYMERKLYRPFAQEDNFATGVGLGLSIVRSIVNQLRGKILIQSEPGEGTDVEITIPIEKPDGSEIAQAIPVGWTKSRDDAEGAVQAVRARASGKRVLISRAVRYDVATRPQEESWNCIERYCSEWFNYQVILGDRKETQSMSADLIITDHYDEAKLDPSGPDGRRILVVHDHIVPHEETRQHHFPVGSIYAPIGPFKLARCILAILDPDPCPPPPSTPKERFMAPPMIPSKPTVSQSYEGSLQRPASASRLPDAGHDQTFANSRPLIFHPPSQVAAQALKENQPSNSPSQKSSQNPTNGLQILAVDDNVLNLQLLHRFLLKRKSDSVGTACNGHEALVSVREASNKGIHFDIIFMDISMPEMDGFEATRLIRSFERSLAHRSASENEHPSVVDAPPGEGRVTEDRGEIEEHRHGRKKAVHRAYVVALTGLASQRARDEAEASGFDDFLTKPVSFEKIGSLLKRLSMEKVVER